MLTGRVSLVMSRLVLSWIYFTSNIPCVGVPAHIYCGNKISFNLCFFGSPLICMFCAIAIDNFPTNHDSNQREFLFYTCFPFTQVLLIFISMGINLHKVWIPIFCVWLKGVELSILKLKKLIEVMFLEKERNYKTMILLTEGIVQWECNSGQCLLLIILTYK